MFQDLTVIGAWFKNIIEVKSIKENCKEFTKVIDEIDVSKC